MNFEHNLLLSTMDPQKYTKVSGFPGKYLVLPHQVSSMKLLPTTGVSMKKNNLKQIKK